MIIKEVNVTASASKNYQKFDVSLTAEITTDQDFEQLKNIAINRALEGIDQLVNNNNPAEIEVKTTQPTPVQPPVRRESYPTAQPIQRPAVPNYYANAPQNQPYSPQNVVHNPNGPKMASEKQIALLRKLRVQCDFNNLTAAQANDLIKGVMGDRNE